MSQVRAATEDFDAATQLLDQAQKLYRPGFYPDVRPIAAMRARLKIAQGDLAAADEWAREHHVTSVDETSYLREYEQLTLVRLLLARHRRTSDQQSAPATDPSPLDTALALLDRLLDAEPSRGGSVIEILMLRALTHHARGHRSQAIANLDHALGQAPDPESHVRVFLDEGAPMLALLRDASHDSAGEHNALSQHARRLLDAAGDSQQTAQRTPRKSDQAALADPLSDRELVVLRLLDSDLTGPQIARELYVSLNTLRTHTKHIFTKLDVNTRAAAVRRAHEHGLL
jgi:LuxR family maltose regulon positive regulatory protein